MTENGGRRCIIEKRGMELRMMRNLNKNYLRMKKTKLFLIGLITLLCLASCQEKDTFQGKLEVSFVNFMDDLEIRIYSIHNESYPIHILPVNDKKIEVELNVGDYLIFPYSTNTYYTKMAFQIMLDRKTTIYYDSSNNGSVRY